MSRQVSPTMVRQYINDVEDLQKRHMLELNALHQAHAAIQIQRLSDNLNTVINEVERDFETDLNALRNIYQERLAIARNRQGSPNARLLQHSDAELRRFREKFTGLVRSLAEDEMKTQGIAHLMVNIAKDEEEGFTRALTAKNIAGFLKLMTVGCVEHTKKSTVNTICILKQGYTKAKEYYNRIKRVAIPAAHSVSSRASTILTNQANNVIELHKNFSTAMRKIQNAADYLFGEEMIHEYVGQRRSRSNSSSGRNSSRRVRARIDSRSPSNNASSTRRAAYRRRHGIQAPPNSPLVGDPNRQLTPSPITPPSA